MLNTLIFNAFRLLVLSLLLANATGCGVVGVIAHATADRRVQPKYTGLAGQSISVMVWADRAIKIEWDRIHSDLANQIQSRLYGHKAKVLEGATWPWPPESVVRYQLDHPGIEALPITDVAPKLGITRLIYVEVDRLTTRGEAAAQMYRGQITATLKIIEVEGKQGKVAYEETGITAIFPKKSPAEGVLNSNDVDIYRGTVVSLAEEIVNRLVGYETD